MQRVDARCKYEAAADIINENVSADYAVVFTDGSVKRGEKSGWVYTVKANKQTEVEGSGAAQLTISSMLIASMPS